MNRKSDELIVPRKPANKTSEVVAELVEGRGSTKSNSQHCAPGRTQRRSSGTSRLLAVRQLAKRNKKQTFNNLFSLIDEELLVTSFNQLKDNQQQDVMVLPGRPMNRHCLLTFRHSYCR